MAANERRNRFFYSWFHCFDAFVIVTSFIVDVVTTGLVEEIASLVVVLRLLRLMKIVDEVSVGASERLEDLEARIETLEQEKAELMARLDGSGASSGSHG